MVTMALQLRLKCRTFRNPNFVHFYSSSSDINGGEDKKESESESQPQSQSPSTISSFFSDVKASLKQPSSPPFRRISQSPLPPPNENPSFSPSKPSKVTPLEEIRKNLSAFRSNRTAPPLPDEKFYNSSSSKTVSFKDLYKGNVIEKSDEGNKNTVGSGKLSFLGICENLRQLRNDNTGNQNQSDRYRGPSAGTSNKVLDPYSLQAFKDSLKMKPDDLGKRPSDVFGGSEPLPQSVFGKDSRRKPETESPSFKAQFVRSYDYGELGKKLRKLRPTDLKGGKNWFSLEELNERLKKLREIEEKEMDSRIEGVSFKDLRDSLVKLRMSSDDKARKSASQRLDILGHLSGTPTFMLAPPKEHLVEQYFHPDNMSSADKLKLELKKVRDEFKMSESDCGSSRVQVAQLTTKIKHLSSVLHKKDKHSRKGLQEMVQRRKKLLRYLRRTDWDSFCLCLDKLGLRDNPDYKN